MLTEDGRRDSARQRSTKYERNCCNYVRQLELAVSFWETGLHVSHSHVARRADRQAVRQIDMQLYAIMPGHKDIYSGRAKSSQAKPSQAMSSRVNVGLLRLLCLCFVSAHVSCLLCPSITCTFAYYNLHKFPNCRSWSCKVKSCCTKQFNNEQIQVTK